MSVHLLTSFRSGCWACNGKKSALPLQGSTQTFPFKINLIVNYISSEAKQQVIQAGGTAHSAYSNHMGLKAVSEVRCNPGNRIE